MRGSLHPARFSEFDELVFNIDIATAVSNFARRMLAQAAQGYFSALFRIVISKRGNGIGRSKTGRDDCRWLFIAFNYVIYLSSVGDNSFAPRMRAFAEHGVFPVFFVPAARCAVPLSAAQSLCLPT